MNNRRKHEQQQDSENFFRSNPVRLTPLHLVRAPTIDRANPTTYERASLCLHPTSCRCAPDLMRMLLTPPLYRTMPKTSKPAGAIESRSPVALLEFIQLVDALQDESGRTAKSQLVSAFVRDHRSCDLVTFFKLLLPKADQRTFHMQDKSIIRVLAAAFGVAESEMLTHLSTQTTAASGTSLGSGTEISDSARIPAVAPRFLPPSLLLILKQIPLCRPRLSSRTAAAPRRSRSPTSTSCWPRSPQRAARASRYLLLLPRPCCLCAPCSVCSLPPPLARPARAPAGLLLLGMLLLLLLLLRAGSIFGSCCYASIIRYDLTAVVVAADVARVQLPLFKRFMRRCSARDMNFVVRLLKKDLRADAGSKVVMDGLHAQVIYIFSCIRNPPRVCGFLKSSPLFTLQ